MRPSPFSRIQHLCLAAIVAFALSACAGDKDKDKLPPDQPVDVLYDKGMSAMAETDYKEAAKQFAEVERQHPYSQWATRAQIMEAYADYQGLDYEGAIKVLGSFIEIHPGNSDVAYAYYLRALCNYERIPDARRDQTAARAALTEFKDLQSRFPDSAYAQDARLKISLIEDHLAGAEMTIGRYYLEQRLYIAASGRFKEVATHYQTTSHVPEALERLVECYVALGLTDEAKRNAAVLGYNFPDSDWYQDAYSLLGRHGVKLDKDGHKS